MTFSLRPRRGRSLAPPFPPPARRRFCGNRFLIIFLLEVIGSAGPTTSSRMDKYTPTMLDQGLKGMIGKGKRSSEVIESIKQNGAVYFAAVGGAGALLSKCIKEAEVIAYDDLGTEAIRKLRVENFPVIVVIDNQGNNLYETAVENFKKLK